MVLPIRATPEMMMAAEMIASFTEKTHIKNSKPELTAHTTNAARMVAARFIYAIEQSPETNDDNLFEPTDYPTAHRLDTHS